MTVTGCEVVQQRRCKVLQQGVEVLRFGLMDYGACLVRMQERHGAIARGEQPPAVICVHHPPVVTMGNRKIREDLRFDPGTAVDSSSLPLGDSKGNSLGGGRQVTTLDGDRLDYFEIDRGGSATAHEPGQLVVYPLLPLDAFTSGVRGVVNLLEETVIRTSAVYGVVATRDEDRPGVWCRKEKLASVGLRIKNRVAMHGLAFNITNSLRAFAAIVPCGLQQCRMTTLQQEILLRTGQDQGPGATRLTASWDSVEESFLRYFADLLKDYTQGRLVLDL